MCSWRSESRSSGCSEVSWVVEGLLSPSWRRRRVCWTEWLSALTVHWSLEWLLMNAQTPPSEILIQVIRRGWPCLYDKSSLVVVKCTEGWEPGLTFLWFGVILGYRTRLWELLYAVWFSWTYHVTSVSLRLPICKMGITILTVYISLMIKVENTCKVLTMIPGTW